MSEELVHERTLTPLVGQECDQIHFFPDKVVIGFAQGDWWLSCTAPPTVHQAGAVVRFPEPGSRDAICSLIDKVAEAATVDRGRADVRFSDGAQLTVDRGGWRVERWRTKPEAKP